MLELEIVGMNTEIDFDMQKYLDAFPTAYVFKKSGF
tara:strand:- start:312 stop:419 length:108 start_codon:yes stop_codon:yes gene_type:complete